MPQTIGEAHSEDASYYGDHPHWLITGSMHRDSDLVTQANYCVIKEELDEQDIEYEESRSGHWMVGWVDYIIVPPTEEEFVLDIEDRLQGYPLLDDEKHSELEQEMVERVMHDECHSFWLAKDYAIEPEALETLAWSSLQDEENTDNDPWYNGVEDWMPDWDWLTTLAERLEQGTICVNCGGEDRDSGRYCGQCLNTKFGIFQYTLDSIWNGMWVTTRRKVNV